MLYKVHVRCEVGVFPAMGRYLEWPFAAKTSKMLCTVFRQNLLVRMRGYLFLLLQIDLEPFFTSFVPYILLQESIKVNI